VNSNYCAYRVRIYLSRLIHLAHTGCGVGDRQAAVLVPLKYVAVTAHLLLDFSSSGLFVIAWLDFLSICAVYACSGGRYDVLLTVAVDVADPLLQDLFVELGGFGFYSRGELDARVNRCFST
jgi:hypothetical protein